MATINFFDILAIEPNFFAEADIDERIDRVKLSNSILRRCGTLLPVYTNTKLFKFFSDTFFYEKKDTIKKLLDTVDVEYNPIDNYNRTEITETESILEAGIGNSVTVTPNLEQENLVSAYDSSDYEPKNKSTSKGEEKRVTTQNGENKTSEKVTSTINGNIGTITTQEMLKQERKIALFDIYQWIAIEFEQQFFICVS